MSLRNTSNTRISGAAVYIPRTCHVLRKTSCSYSRRGISLTNTDSARRTGAIAGSATNCSQRTRDREEQGT
jgi:hypothetical protein